MLISQKPNWKALEKKYSPIAADKLYDMDEVDRRELLADNYCDYSVWNLKIKDKSGDIIPFEMNREQMFLHDIAERMRRETGMVRIILLKGRQWGGSTYIGGRLYHKTTHEAGRNAFILAHHEDSTKNLFRMVERFHDHCNPGMRPQTDRTNAKELRFSAMDGGYRVGTAGGRDPGTSFTNQYVHWSEVSKSPNADDIKASLLQTVPLREDTEVWLESTAKGAGGCFHQHWIDSVNGSSGYWAVFIPWYWHEEYRMPVPKGFTPTESEVQLARRFNLDAGQLVWRRFKMGELKPSEGGNPEDLFKQEYPCTWQEAFLFSGRTVFAPGKLEKAREECFAPKFRGEINQTVGRFVRRKDGRMLVWELPKQGERYSVGGDPAEGLPTGDYSSLHVVNVKTGQTVAHWRGTITPEDFGDLMYWVGMWYNKALLVPEANNHGHLVIYKLQERNYANLFQREMEDSPDGKKVKKYGFLSTRKSKPEAIDLLAEELNYESDFCWDVDTIDEMQTFIIDDTLAMHAQEGCYDDRVMSRALAEYGRRRVYFGRPKQAPVSKLLQGHRKVAGFTKQRGVVLPRKTPIKRGLG